MMTDRIKQHIARFLSRIEDEHRFFGEAYDFLIELQQMRSASPPPVLEVITVLKKEKPILYAFLKQRVHTRGLSLLFELNMDYEQAKQRLEL